MPYNFKSLISLYLASSSHSTTTADFTAPRKTLSHSIHNNGLFFIPSSSYQKQRIMKMTSSSSSSSSSSPSSLSSHNKLQSMKKLSNDYYALRHGQSKANIAKIISSDPIISTVEHGLTDVGKDQVYSSASKFCEEYGKKSDGKVQVAIYSSDFTRARETALIFANVLPH